MQTKNLNLNYKKPIVASDGNGVFITENGQVNLIFFQFRGQGPQGVMADVVAGVRLNSIEELKEFKHTISDVIKQHESREK